MQTALKMAAAGIILTFAAAGPALAQQTRGASPDYDRDIAPPGLVDAQGQGSGLSGFSNSGN